MEFIIKLISVFFIVQLTANCIRSAPWPFDDVPSENEELDFGKKCQCSKFLMNQRSFRVTHVKPPETDIALGNCIRQIPLSILFTRHPNPQLMIVCHHCSVCFTFAIKAININKDILIM